MSKSDSMADSEIPEETVRKVLALYDELDERSKHVYSKKQIMELTGLQKKVVNRIIQERPIESESDEPGKNDAPAPVHDKDTRPPAGAHTPAPARETLSQEMIAHDLVTFLNASKRGINEIRKASDKEYREMRDKKMTEAQWMHLYGMGIKIGVKATGLSAESLMQAVDDYEIDLTDALERFNNRYRD